MSKISINNKKGISELLIDFLHDLSYEALPWEVVAQAKRCLLDYLGVAFAGSTTGTAAKLQKFLSKFSDESKITAIGYHKRTDVFKAALVNGMTSHVLELDDGERRASVHPSSTVISTILSLTEKEGIKGKDALVGIVGGYEIALRIGRAIQPSHRNRGFHATATCGTLGAAMAASKALNLSKEEMCCALGIAGSSASGLLQFLEDGSEVKQYHPGKAALCGILAAYLAQSGLTAPPNILEGKRGFLQALSEEFDEAPLVEGLGEKFAILEVYFKPYAACRHCHAPLEAILSIREKMEGRLDQIAKITVSTYRSAIDGHDNPHPQSVVGAKMSVPFSVATALKSGWAGPKEFESSSFCDPEILSLASRVTLKEDPTFTALVPEKRPALVEVLLKDGRQFQERVDLPKGEPENPMNDAEIKKKFSELASCCRSKEERSKIIEIVEKAEEQIGKIFPYLY